MPVAATEKVADEPGQLVRLEGSLTTMTFSLTVRVALRVMGWPQVPLTVTL